MTHVEKASLVFAIIGFLILVCGISFWDEKSGKILIIVGFILFVGSLVLTHWV